MTESVLGVLNTPPEAMLMVSAAALSALAMLTVWPAVLWPSVSVPVWAALPTVRVVAAPPEVIVKPVVAAIVFLVRVKLSAIEPMLSDVAKNALRQRVVPSPRSVVLSVVGVAPL